jgi:hypothetical protein
MIQSSDKHNKFIYYTPVVFVEGDFDWEEEHEKYAEVIDHVKHGERMRDSGYGAISLKEELHIQLM